MGTFLSDGIDWLVDNLTNEAGQFVTIAIDGKDPVHVKAIVTEEKRERRENSGTIQIVNTRTLTVSNDVGVPEFSGLFQAKLSAVVSIDGRDYAVESSQNHRGAIVLELSRESRSEHSRPGYRNRGR